MSISNPVILTLLTQISSFEWLILGGNTEDGDTTSGEVFNLATGEPLTNVQIELPVPIANHDVVRLDDLSFFVANTGSFQGDDLPDPVYLYRRAGVSEAFEIVSIRSPPFGRRTSAVAGIVTNSERKQFLVVAGGTLEDFGEFGPNSTEIYDIGM